MASLTLVRNGNTYIQDWTVKEAEKQNIITLLSTAAHNFNQNPTTSSKDALAEMRQMETAFSDGLIDTGNIDDFLDIFWPLRKSDDSDKVSLTLYSDGNIAVTVDADFDQFNLEETT